MPIKLEFSEPVGFIHKECVNLRVFMIFTSLTFHVFLSKFIFPSNRMLKMTLMLLLFCCNISHKKGTPTFPYLSKLYYHVQFQDSKISVVSAVLASQLRALRAKLTAEIFMESISMCYY